MKSFRCLAIFTAALLGACATQTPRTPATESFVKRTAERPGLGTRWGEARVSWVEPAYFARAWRDRPAAKGAIYYNDREGADAMLDFLGERARLAPGLQPVGDAVKVGLRNGDGRWLDAWEARGRRIAAGETGGRYEVVVKNETRRRVEVVVSVDGLDTLDGGDAAFKKRGYVLGPRQTFAIEGFRTSDGGVAAFRFGGMGDSYSQRRFGHTTNAGIIGVAVFEERFLGTPMDKLRPEHRAVQPAEAREFPSSRGYASPPEA